MIREGDGMFKPKGMPRPIRLKSSNDYEALEKQFGAVSRFLKMGKVLKSVPKHAEALPTIKVKVESGILATEEEKTKDGSGIHDVKLEDYLPTQFSPKGFTKGCYKYTAAINRPDYVYDERMEKEHGDDLFYFDQKTGQPESEDSRKARPYVYQWFVSCLRDDGIGGSGWIGPYGHLVNEVDEVDDIAYLFHRICMAVNRPSALIDRKSVV